jgi:hypothetical protein
MRFHEAHPRRYTMSNSARLTVALLFATITSGCADTTPARIEFQQPSGTIYGKSPSQLAPQVVNEDGEPLATHSVSISAIPTDIVNVQGTAVTCAGSGDAVVHLSGGGMSTNFTIQCRLVDRIATTPSMDLVLNTDPTPLTATALDEQGNAMADVRMQATSTNPSVAAVQGTELVAKSVGETTITISAGDASANIPVRVVEKILSDNLVLADGETSTRTFDRGSYSVEINVSSDGTTYGVEAHWVGENCAPHAEARRLAMNCRVNNTASLVVENPTTFGIGPTATGNITIYRGP